MGGSLLYSNVVFRYVHCLSPDSLASSLSIATIGCLLLTVLRPQRSWGWWLLLGASIFITYQLRPVYLFLVPLAPVLGFALWWLSPGRIAERRAGRALVARLTLVAALPLLLFCTSRWLLVGEISLVSFGGNNFAGVVSCSLDEHVAQQLPDRVRPLADAVLQRRREIAERDPNYAGEVTRSYAQIESRFNIETWEVCVPAARQLYGDDWPQVNRSLAQLALAIVRAQPVDYGSWLAKAFVRGVYMITSEFVANPIYLAVLACLALFHARCVVLRRSRGDYQLDGKDYYLQINALWLIAIGFAITTILTVIITSPPLGRFMDPGGVFVIAVAVRALLQRIELGRKLSRAG